MDLKTQERNKKGKLLYAFVDCRKRPERCCLIKAGYNIMAVILLSLPWTEFLEVYITLNPDFLGICTVLIGIVISVFC